jgi:hypothetical protein
MLEKTCFVIEKLSEKKSFYKQNLEKKNVAILLKPMVRDHSVVHFHGTHILKLKNMKHCHNIATTFP